MVRDTLKSILFVAIVVSTLVFTVYVFADIVNKISSDFKPWDYCDYREEYESCY